MMKNLIKVSIMKLKKITFKTKESRLKNKTNLLECLMQLENKFPTEVNFFNKVTFRQIGIKIKSSMEYSEVEKMIPSELLKGSEYSETHSLIFFNEIKQILEIENLKHNKQNLLMELLLETVRSFDKKVALELLEVYQETLEVIIEIFENKLQYDNEIEVGKLIEFIIEHLYEYDFMNTKKMNEVYNDKIEELKDICKNEVLIVSEIQKRNKGTEEFQFLMENTVERTEEISPLKLAPRITDRNESMKQKLKEIEMKCSIENAIAEKKIQNDFFETKLRSYHIVNLKDFMN